MGLRKYLLGNQARCANHTSNTLWTPVTVAACELSDFGSLAAVAFASPNPTPLRSLRGDFDIGRL
jgi:hypothetical protein